MTPELSSSFDNILPGNEEEEGTENDSVGSSCQSLTELFDSCRKITVLNPTHSEDGGVGVGADGRRQSIKTCLFVPPLPPKLWIQRPILLRVTPRSGMKIRGLRYSSSKTYLPIPETGLGSRCILPINNGFEEPGKCLVIDFESDLFIGTAMIRIKNAVAPHPSGSNSNNNVTSSYFDGRKRTFQGIVRGRFKVPGIPMSECVTGQVFDYPAGTLPNRYFVMGAISIVSYLAPQLQARLDGDCPRFLSPFVSTSQTTMACPSDADVAYTGADESIESELSEPQPSDSSSLLHNLETVPPDSDSVRTRIKNRKKTFDKLYANHDKTITFDPNSEYTFEFFQHLLMFDEFALNFVKPIGKLPLDGILNGQPLKFMAAHQMQEENDSKHNMNWLWSFDLWHESIYDDAKVRDDGHYCSDMPR